MSNVINIDVEKTGFPVKIGQLEIWFDSSLENLRRFFNVEEIAQKKLKEAQDKAQHIHFPTDINVDNVHEVDTKTVDAAIDVNKEFIAAQYDIIFGNGTFKKIYKEYPDIIALESALEPIGIAISKKIEEQEKERSSLIEDKQREYLNKKATKK